MRRSPYTSESPQIAGIKKPAIKTGFFVSASPVKTTLT
jgi:hypothetical protein